ncbi:MAG: P-II family nitrogen regulator [Bacillota bacterium]|nr:P-II family nitrogen regulator [Bacillota bacterium]
MKKLDVIIRPSKLEVVKEALGKSGVKGMTITHVTGCGLQQGRTEFYRGSVYNVNLLPKVKIELVINDDSLDEVIKTIREVATTGEIGDGKIFVYPVENAIRIRTGDQGTEAV